MDDARIPAHLEVTGLIRAVEAAGGFGTVLSKGERDAGTLMIICCHNGTQSCAFERMPHPDGGRKWTQTKHQDPENPYAFFEFWQKRARQDSDLWIVELDHPEAAKILSPDAAVN